ncbi:MAG: RNA polymerase [Rhizobiales bacterium]|nr:RNA polymerase [Hyphomicrobiales bacterium]OJY05016.1 MAG: RNA polymerase [Rhizobiales bacterium 63-22]
MMNKQNFRVSGAGIQTIQRSRTDILGPNSEIGLKLRSLYSSIQDESIPDRFLDLLEKLDRVEQAGGRA